MAIRVTVNSVPKNRVSINNQQRDTIRTVGLASAQGTATTRIDDLLDVNATNKGNNYTLVYDTASEKYIVRELPILDGGTY